MLNFREYFIQREKLNFKTPALFPQIVIDARISEDSMKRIIQTIL